MNEISKTLTGRGENIRRYKAQANDEGASAWSAVPCAPNIKMHIPNPWSLRLLFASRPDALSYVYVLELGRNKFEGPASDFDDLEKVFWVA